MVDRHEILSAKESMACSSKRLGSPNHSEAPKRKLGTAKFDKTEFRIV